MPNRIIKESTFTSDRIAQLSDFEFRLWVGLITQADDTGHGDARPAIIKGRVFALRERTTVKDIEIALHALAAAGCVSLYEVDGKPYFRFPRWADHQRVRNAVSKYPEESESDNPPQVAASCGELPRDAALIQSNPIQSESNPNPNPKVSAEVSAPVALLPLNDGTDYAVSETKEREWAALFPAVDVAQELREMRAWLMANKAKRKTRNGIERFVVSWLGREQDRGRPAANIKTKPPEERSAPGRKEFEAMRRMMGGRV